MDFDAPSECPLILNGDEDIITKESVSNYASYFESSKYKDNKRPASNPNNLVKIFTSAYYTDKGNVADAQWRAMTYDVDQELPKGSRYEYRRAGQQEFQQTVYFANGTSLTYGDHDPKPLFSPSEAFYDQVFMIEQIEQRCLKRSEEPKMELVRATGRKQSFNLGPRDNTPCISSPLPSRFPLVRLPPPPPHRSDQEREPLSLHGHEQSWTQKQQSNGDDASDDGSATPRPRPKEPYYGSPFGAIGDSRSF